MPPQALVQEHALWGQAAERRIVPLPARGRRSRPAKLRNRLRIPRPARPCGLVLRLAPSRAPRQARFEHVVFDTSERSEDDMTARLRGYGVPWHRVASLSDDELAAADTQGRDRRAGRPVRAYGGNRLEVFARKPAPVQVTWLGYLCTTGLTQMDFRLTDQEMDPAGITEGLHTERAVSIAGPGLLQPAGRRSSDRPVPGGPGEPLTYGSVNQWAKVSSAVKDAWAEILQRMPGARLFVIARGGQNPKLQQMIVRSSSSAARARTRSRCFRSWRCPISAAPRADRRGARSFSLRRRHHDLPVPVDGGARRHARRTNRLVAQFRRAAEAGRPR